MDGRHWEGLGGHGTRLAPGGRPLSGTVTVRCVSAVPLGYTQAPAQGFQQGCCRLTFSCISFHLKTGVRSHPGLPGDPGGWRRMSGTPGIGGNASGVKWVTLKGPRVSSRSACPPERAVVSEDHTPFQGLGVSYADSSPPTPSRKPSWARIFALSSSSPLPATPPFLPRAQDPAVLCDFLREKKKKPLGWVVCF